jgi:hypothetical protein
MRTKRTTKQQKTAVTYARARGESLDEENQTIQAQLRACQLGGKKRIYCSEGVY